MTKQPDFEFEYAGSFAANTAAFAKWLKQLDEVIGPTLSTALSDLVSGKAEKPKLYNALLARVSAPKTENEQQPSIPEAPPSSANDSASNRWFLEKLEIEGFRGINNEKDPLVIKFKTDGVNSISAPNGVGKSSIFDAISFALTGGIEKLDRLLQSERGQEYYVNRFHPAGQGTVTLTLMPDGPGESVDVTVVVTSTGARTVTGPVGVDAEALLADLNREFVLLDGQTFQSFIDLKALERGRMFSGLLGLNQYSTLRQELQALANTSAFNSHFDAAGHSATKKALEGRIRTTKAAIAADYKLLVKEALEPTISNEDAQARCHAALSGSPILIDHCAEQPFLQLNIDTCIEAVKAAEGGPKRTRFAEIIREQEMWSKADRLVPAESDLPLLNRLATARDQALVMTAGDLLSQLYRLSERVISDEGWPSPSLCPTCERDDGTSVLDKVQAKLGQYDAVEVARTAVATEWTTKGWGDLSDFETLTVQPGQAPRLKHLTKAGEAGTISAEEASELAAYVQAMRLSAKTHVAELTKEHARLEKELPASLVAVTTDIETARRLQTNWRELGQSLKSLEGENVRAGQVDRIKKFLDNVSSAFATADSAMATIRLKKVEPLCKTLFQEIMACPVVPALLKPPGSEELTIQLAEFWGLKDVSAQALLSESFRNAFAVSVYLAAASLYGGAPRFMILDDVTSSFDAGHQHHLIEVIRTSFARPLTPGGPQLILLSHDTFLEKLFNKHSGSTEWHHQRLEGTARTSVLLQSGAVNKLRDATLDLLDAGRIGDAAPRIRPYLEYVLHNVIDRLRIPVPMDLAFGDEKRTPGNYLEAIQAAVELNEKAGILVLEAAQLQKLGMHSTTIVGNYLSHWSTGQTSAFSASALMGVMRAIDEFSECFRFEPAPGQPRRFYRSLSKRV